MIIETLFPHEPMEPGQTLSFIAKKLAERITDLENMLDDECRRSKHLDDLLMTIGANVEIGHSDYSHKDYLSLGYIDENDRCYQELLDYWNLRKEENECEDTN